jgi:hypothetical protein
MAFTKETLEENFTEAANHWNLEKLYLDLAVAKGRSLTPVEKKFLRGLLCGYSPAEIAAQVYKSPTSSAVRVYLSNGLYKYIQELLDQQSQTTTPIKNWSRVTTLLEKAGYKLESNQQLSSSDRIAETQSPVKCSQSVSNSVNQYQEWQEAVDVATFYGRQNELNQLEQWIIQDNCRLIAILGMGGVGKTILAVKLAQQTQQQFECLIWRSLATTPPLEDLLEDLIHCLSQGQEINLPVTVEGKISLLMTYLRGFSGESTTLKHRYLLVLDQVEAILRPQTFAGCYREGYEAYGQFFRRLGEECHHSCCLLISREKPKDIALMAGAKLPVHTFQLGGLKTAEGVLLLQAKGYSGCQDEQQLLARLYANNPLALKIVATTIQDVFDGNITEFLAERTLVVGDIRELLDEQFSRLSELERQMLYGLATHHGLVRLASWPTELVVTLSKRERLEAVESLQRRSIIEKQPAGFKLPPIVRIYVAQQLSEQMAQEMTIKEVEFLKNYTLLGSLLNDDSTPDRSDASMKLTTETQLAKRPD